MDRIEVLLTTFNSSDYLAEMLESLLSQTFDDFHLIVSDDCSADDTLAILDTFAPRFRNAVVIGQPDAPTGGAMRNFARLLSQSTGDYVLLADHDDAWHPDKIANAVRDLKAAEATHGVDTPIAYHCDLHVIDSAGHLTNESYWDFKRIDPKVGEDLSACLIHPMVTGCAMAMNAALVGKALPIPQDALMHDWWIALVAAAFGKVIHDPIPHVSYRIHGKNVTRPKEVSLMEGVRRPSRIGDLRRGLRQRILQGQAFDAQYGDTLPQEKAQLVAVFASLSQTTQGLRQFKIIKHGFLGPDFLRNTVLLLLI